MKEKWNSVLPWLFMALFALTRWPGVLPLNFSAAYGLVFCAGVYNRRIPWWMMLGTMLVTDVSLNIFYYDREIFSDYQAVNYLAFGAIYFIGRMLKAKTHFAGLLGGGLFGAVLFYIITNSASWWYNPEYAKTLSGWLQALSIGTSGWPETWKFFQNTLLSGGLFTALFVGAMKATSPEEDEAHEPVEEPAPEGAVEPKSTEEKKA
ncbi:MAG TPA: DUF6580 family putative transport protein [Roseimicrobium sp.]|nr:DUF6580 family putative transport protein [Roseimicrobium sp.]